MSKNKIISLATVIIIMIILGALSYIENLEVDNSQLKALTTALEKKLEYKTNEYDQVYAEKEIALLNRDLAEEVYKEKLKQYKKILGAKNVQTATEVKTITVGGGTTILRDTVIDTVYYSKVSIKEQWFTFQAVIKDSVNYTYSVTDSLSIVTNLKKRLFKNDVYSIKAISHNPKTRITGLDNITISERRNKISIGPALLYDPFSNSFKVGISLQYSLISL